MSVNRALVEFYISFKLSQRNFPLDQLGLSEPAGQGLDSAELGGARTEAQTRTEALGATVDQDLDQDLARTAGLDSELSCSVNGRSNSPSASAMLAPPDSASSPLLRNSDPPPVAMPPVATPTELSLIKEALRDSALEFELRFSLAFSDLQRQLHLTPASAYRSFESVMDEVFRDGVNWGRVVGLFAFGGALAVECVDKEMSSLVSKIMDWMSLYLDNHIQEWIDQQGGWSRFAELYGDDAAAQSRRSQESLRRWFWAGATLVTGVVVGSILATKRL